MVGGDTLSLDEPSGERWDLALDLLGRGETVLFRGLGLTLEPGELRVLKDTRWKSGVSEAQARAELASAESVVSTLLDASPELRALVGDRRTVYRLIDDYGMGAIWLAELREGEFSWTQ